MGYPKLNENTETLKIKTKNDEIEEIKNKTEKLVFENVLKSLIIDIEYYKKKFKFLNKIKFFWLFPKF